VTFQIRGFDQCFHSCSIVYLTKWCFWVSSFAMIRFRISYPRSLGSWNIKWTVESFPRIDSSVPLMSCDPSDQWSLFGLSQWNVPLDCVWGREWFKTLCGPLQCNRVNFELLKNFKWLFRGSYEVLTSNDTFRFTMLRKIDSWGICQFTVIVVLLFLMGRDPIKAAARLSIHPSRRAMRWSVLTRARTVSSCKHK